MTVAVLKLWNGYFVTGPKDFLTPHGPIQIWNYPFVERHVDLFENNPPNNNRTAEGQRCQKKPLEPRPVAIHLGPFREIDGKQQHDRWKHG